MPNKENNKTVPTVSLVLSDGSLAELVYDRDELKTYFLIGKGDVQSQVESIKLPSGEVLVPVKADHSLIRHRVVLLPSDICEYGATPELVDEIKQYLRRYVTLAETFTDVAAYYTLLSWVYDAFNEVPYLRFKGDFGSGKTRALAVVGSITYKPIFASGASTVSPIFHSLDLFKGTLVFDEADFRFSDERAELTKIFNNGTVKGFPVLRTSVSDKKEFDPKAFAVYGPKVVGMREVFQDYALESRFITEEMPGHAGPGVPISLPATQREEAQVLRNKLLLFRFRERHRVKIDESLADASLSLRANQILLPLLSIIPDEDVRERIKRHMKAQEEEMARDRSTQVEALILETIADFLEKDPARTDIPLAMIRAAVNTRHGTELDRPLTSRQLGSIIRNKIRLKSFKQGTYMVEMPQAPILVELCKRFGLRT